jgi:hypothetical protein
VHIILRPVVVALLPQANQGAAQECKEGKNSHSICGYSVDAVPDDEAQYNKVFRVSFPVEELPTTPDIENNVSPSFRDH